MENYFIDNYLICVIPNIKIYINIYELGFSTDLLCLAHKATHLSNLSFVEAVIKN